MLFLFHRIVNPKTAKRLRITGLAALLGVSFWAGSPALPESMVIGQAPTQYPKVQLAGMFSQELQRVTGLTLLSGWVANHLAESQLHRHRLLGKLRVRLSPSSATDLAAGRIGRVRFSGRDLSYDGYFPIHRLTMETDAQSPLYFNGTKRPVLLQPIQVKLKATMTEADINRFLQSPQGQAMLNNVKIQLPPFGAQHVDLLQPAVNLLDGRLTAHTLVNMHESPMENALPVQLSAQLTADRSRLDLSDLNLAIEGIQDTRPIARFVETYFSEVANLGNVKIKHHQVTVNIDSCDIKNGQVQLNATIRIRPDDQALQKLMAAQANIHPAQTTR